MSTVCWRSVSRVYYIIQSQEHILLTVIMHLQCCFERLTCVKITRLRLCAYNHTDADITLIMRFLHWQTAICNGTGLGQPGLVTLYNIASSDSSHAVWPSGKALGWKAEGTRFDSASALRSLQKLWFMDAAVFVSLPTTPHPHSHIPRHTLIHSQ